MNQILEQDIKYLKGVGPKRAELLNKELNIFTFGDLLYYFPYKYIDRSKFYKIKEIDTTLTFIQIRGKIISYRTEGPPRKKSYRLYSNPLICSGRVTLYNAASE